MIKTILALICAIFLGYSLTHLPFDFVQIRWEIWAAISFLCAIGIGICLYLSQTPKREELKVEKDLHRFQNEFKQALRGHLKISILFWSYYYKKEKVKTLEEAKKEVFQDLKKEFTHLRWMESMLEEIRQELAKYK
jgi:hypothetical protein